MVFTWTIDNKYLHSLTRGVVEASRNSGIHKVFIGFPGTKFAELHTIPTHSRMASIFESRLTKDLLFPKIQKTLFILTVKLFPLEIPYSRGHVIFGNLVNLDEPSCTGTGININWHGTSQPIGRTMFHAHLNHITIIGTLAYDLSGWLDPWNKYELGLY